MKTFVAIALDARRPKADGTCPILLRIIHHGKASQISIIDSMRKFVNQVTECAVERGVNVVQYSREDVIKVLAPMGATTKTRNSGEDHY